ncbi:MAG TPA: methyltransferase [Planctomycetaceae bacterium]|nr:methyltransferase [Planctomycetaceae bacterium]
MQQLDSPAIDPTSIFEYFRGSYGTELLTAAVAHFDLFGRLAQQPRTLVELQTDLNLAERSAIVLTTALRAMGLLTKDSAGKFELTPLAAEHLVRGTEFDVGSYLSLAATSPGVIEMVERLRTNRPAGLGGDEGGAAFIYRDGMKSAMEQTQLAEHFTLALSGRAKNVAPVLAQQVRLNDATTLLDVGGGTGIYSIAFLKANPQLQAIVFDRPEVLKTAERFANDYGVADRLQPQSGDMFADPLPAADVILLSNILHDWDVAECQTLIQRSVKSLNPGGRLIIHDVLLNDELDGPLPIALYSAALFSFTEGRAYSAKEYNTWLTEAGLRPQSPVPTLIHCHAIVAGHAG